MDDVIDRALVWAIWGIALLLVVLGVVWLVSNLRRITRHQKD
jgi:hypothetical protein